MWEKERKPTSSRKNLLFTCTCRNFNCLSYYDKLKGYYYVNSMTRLWFMLERIKRPKRMSDRRRKRGLKKIINFQCAYVFSWFAKNSMKLEKKKNEKRGVWCNVIIKNGTLKTTDPPTSRSQACREQQTAHVVESLLQRECNGFTSHY